MLFPTIHLKRLTALQRITWSCQSVREQTLIIQVIEELEHYTNLDFCYVPNMADADIKIGIIPDVNAGGKSTVRDTTLPPSRSE